MRTRAYTKIFSTDFIQKLQIISSHSHIGWNIAILFFHRDYDASTESFFVFGGGGEGGWERSQSIFTITKTQSVSLNQEDCKTM